MQPDVGQHAAKEHADRAKSLLSSAEAALSRRSGSTELKIALAQAHAILALALETRAAAYDTRTAAYVTYLEILAAGGHASNAHAAVVDKLVRDRLGFDT
jgi:hypothetical protein